MKEDQILLINNLLSHFGTLVFLGVIHILYRERRMIVSHLKGRNDRGKRVRPSGYVYWKPLLKRCLYLLWGLLLGLLAWALVNFILTKFLTPSGVSDYNPSNRPWGDSIGIIGVWGFLLAAGSLILSAGQRWFVQLAKILATVTVLFLFLSVFFLFLRIS